MLPNQPQNFVESRQIPLGDRLVLLSLFIDDNLWNRGNPGLWDVIANKLEASEDYILVLEIGLQLLEVGVGLLAIAASLSDTSIHHHICWLTL